MSVGYTNVPAPKVADTPKASGKSAHNKISCANIRETLSRVGDKWSILTITILSDAPLRFNELRRQIEGISQRMLTRTLRALERDGLVTRTVTPTNPPSVEYALTDLGHTLLEPVRTLVAWTQTNHPQISAAQQRFDIANVKE